MDEEVHIVKACISTFRVVTRITLPWMRRFMNSCFIPTVWSRKMLNSARYVQKQALDNFQFQHYILACVWYKKQWVSNNLVLSVVKDVPRPWFLTSLPSSVEFMCCVKYL